MNSLILTDDELSVKIIAKLFFSSQQESQAAIEGFRISETMVNGYKFQVTVVKKFYKVKDSYPLNTINQIINSKNCVELPRTEINQILSFEKHICTLWQKDSN